MRRKTLGLLIIPTILTIAIGMLVLGMYIVSRTQQTSNQAKDNVVGSKSSIPELEGGRDIEFQTRVIVYTPKVGNYPQKAGECWTTSTALQGRKDSFRCSIDHSIIDPCFEINDKIICDANPLEEGDEFELIYAKSLPKNTVISDRNKGFSWVYQLEDGSHCFLMQGTAGSVETGEFYYYVCDDNKVIIGEVDKGNDLWKAEVGYLAGDDSQKLNKRQIQSVITAWE